MEIDHTPTVPFVVDTEITNRTNVRSFSIGYAPCTFANNTLAFSDPRKYPRAPRETCIPRELMVFPCCTPGAQGYIWSLSGGWTMWHGMCTISLFSLASALGVAAWTALTIFLPPCKIAALTCACHAMALSVLPYGTGTYMRTAVTMLTAFATSASVVVRLGNESCLWSSEMVRGCNVCISTR